MPPTEMEAPCRDCGTTVRADGSVELSNEPCHSCANLVENTLNTGLYLYPRIPL